MCKYIINEKEQCIVQTDTGDIFRPACIVDLIAYHAYLLSSGKVKQAKELLKDIAKGEKVISKMISRMQE